MEYRPYYLSREWVKLGHNVKILAASQSHVRTNQPEISKAVEYEIIDGIQYHWYKTPRYKGNGFGRIKNMFAFIFTLWWNAKKIANEFKPDIVIASSTYPMDIWPAHRIAKLTKAKLVFEVHDLWPLSPMELGKMSKWHPFIMLVQLAEDYAYKYSDHVISMLPKAKEYMESRGMKSDKFNYIPNGIDIAEWENVAELPNDIKYAINAIKLKGKTIIGYAGAHGLANSLDTLLDVAKKSISDFEYILVGNGPERERLALRIQAENISNITLLPAIPKITIPAFLRTIDIAYIGLLPEPLFRFGISPNKLMDYMVAGVPIIMAIKAGNDLVSETGCGITVSPGNIDEIHNAIIKITKLSKMECQIMGRKGRKFILAEQTYPILAKRFLNTIESSYVN